MIDRIAEIVQRGAEALRKLLDPDARSRREPAYAPVPVLVPVRARSRAARYGGYR